MSTMTGVKAGKAFIIIEALDKTTATFNKVSGTFKAWGGKMQKLGQSILLKTFAAMTPAAFGFAAFKEFDDIMQRVKGRTEASALELKGLRREARSAGKDLGYTSTEVARLMDELAQKGFKQTQMGGGILGSTLDLARAAGPGTEVDTTQAADLIGTMLNAYDLEKTEKNVKHLADVFALAANRGNYSLEEFKETMKTAAIMGKELGVPIEDLVSMASQLRDVAIESESVGIAIRNISLRLSKKDKVEKFNAMLEKLTGKTIQVGDASNNMRPIPDILEEIGKAMAGLGSLDRINLMDELIGDKAVTAGMNLSRKGGPFKSLRDELLKSEGYSHRAALAMNEGFGGAWRKFVYGIEQVAFSFSDALKPAVIDIGEKLMGALVAFSKWIDANPEAASKLVVLTAGFIALGVTIFTAGIALKILAPAIFLVGMLARGLVLTLKMLEATTIFLKIAFITTQLATASMSIGFGIAKLTAIGLATTLKLTRYALLALNTVILATVAAIPIVVGSIRTMIAVLATTRVALFAVSRTMAGVKVTATILTVSIGSLKVAFMLATRAMGAVKASILAINIAFKGMNALFVISKAAMAGAATGLILYKAAVTSAGASMILFKTTLLSTQAAFSLIPLLTTALSGAISLLLSPLGAFLVAAVAIGAIIYLNRETIFDFLAKAIQWSHTNLSAFWGDLTSFFGSLWKTAKEVGGVLVKTFTGVTDALTLGDTEAAWQVGLQGLSTAWAGVYDMLMDTWEGFTGFFVEAWLGAVQEVQAAWFTLQKSLTKGMLSMSEEDGPMGDLMRAMGIDMKGNKERNDAMNQSQIALQEKVLRDIASGEYEKAGWDPESIAQFKKDTEGTLAKLKGGGFDMNTDFVDQEFDKAIEKARETGGKKVSERRQKIAEANAKREGEFGKKKIALDEKLAEIARRKAEKDKELADSLEEISFTPAVPDGLGGLGGATSGIALKADDALLMNTMDAAKRAWENSTRTDRVDPETADRKKGLELLDEAVKKLTLLEETLSVA
jgi:TP901 family phage tail tape measure protein